MPLWMMQVSLEPWQTVIKNTFLLAILRSGYALHKCEENIQKHHTVALNFPDFGWCVTQEPLNGKNWFQAHIVEQHKSY